MHSNNTCKQTNKQTKELTINKQNVIMWSNQCREEAWWARKRLATSADSWESFVAEYCGFDWQEEEEQEEEEMEELALKEGAIVNKEVRTEKNMVESPLTAEDSNLDELVSNENNTTANLEEKEVDTEPTSEEGQKSSGHFELNEELLNPVANLMASPNDGNVSPKMKADLFICYKCKKSLKSGRQLQTHQAFQHETVEEEEIKCMVMKCGKMFRKTSTLDNHMRGHQETGSSQNFPPNLFGPVLLQKKPKLAGLRFPLQQIQNQDSQTKLNGNHQDQNQKNLPQKRNFHQFQVDHNQQLKTEAPPHQPWRDPPHL